MVREEWVTKFVRTYAVRLALDFVHRFRQGAMGMAEVPAHSEPVSIERVDEVMKATGLWWAIAGGWAIDLWLGVQTREHHDVEVVVRRIDQGAVRAALVDDWELLCLDPLRSGWRSWSGHRIEPPAFQLQARGAGGAFDLFLETADDEHWSYRRAATVRRRLAEVTATTASSVPVVRPEVQLLYMATSGEPKNADDFAIAAPRLGRAARAWLVEALGLAHPGHPWLVSLAGVGAEL